VSAVPAASSAPAVRLLTALAVDAYRNKMRSTMLAPGHVSTAPNVAPHFETRVGKRRWLERGRKSKRAASP
jgi:hypothetical protein